MVKRLRFFRFFVSLLVTGILGSCGIEDYPYLYSIDAGDVSLTLNTTAFIRLPTYTDPEQLNYFQNFIIYYRIYISGTPIEGTVSTDQLSQINSALSSDYYSFLSYTNTDDTTVPGNMGSIFSNRRYYPLDLQGTNIGDELDTGSFGKVITLDFGRSSPLHPGFFLGNAPQSDPSVPRNNLLRYSDYNMHPYANNRYFTNSSDLNDGDLINQSTLTNLDVANNTVSGPKYTYTAMYIMAYGVDENNGFSPIYSSPTFIGVFRLPD
jgi:hypothetical protein